MPASRARTSPVTGAPSAREPSADRPGRAAPPSTGRAPGALCSSRTGTLPVHTSCSSGAGRWNRDVTVNCAASAPAARSSTATISVTRGPARPRAQWTTTSMLSLTRVLSARSGQLARRVRELADEPQAGEGLASRARVDGGEALHARRQREQERQRLLVPDLTDDRDVGRHAQEAGHEPTQVDRGTIGSRRRASACSRRSATGRRPRTPPRRRRPGATGSSSAAQHESSVVLPGSRGTGHDDGLPARTHAARKRRGRGGQHVALHELVEVAERHAGELPDVDHHVPASADVAVHDVEAGAVVELGVLQALGRVELAVRTGGVVEDLGERADDVLVVVEHLVVVAGPPAVPLHEDGIGPVDHHLPHVVVVEQRLEGAVAGQVAERPLGHQVGLAEVVGPQAPAMVERPARHLVRDQRSELVPSPAGHLQGDVLGALLHRALDLLEGAQVTLHVPPSAPLSAGAPCARCKHGPHRRARASTRAGPSQRRARRSGIVLPQRDGNGVSWKAN